MYSFFFNDLFMLVFEFFFYSHLFVLYFNEYLFYVQNKNHYVCGLIGSKK